MLASKVKERPMLMSAPMVLATLAGTKTQTRRTTGLDDVNENPGIWESNGIFTSDGFGELGYMAKKSAKGKPGATFKTNKLADRTINVCPQVFPYGKPGDRLWVKETWKMNTPPSGALYRADANSEFVKGPWKPSIFMFRWASRITLGITEIRVQRLQDISEEDAIAEGIERVNPDMWKDYGPAREPMHSPILSYASLWESINGAGSWSANPWVWAISFRKI